MSGYERFQYLSVSIDDGVAVIEAAHAQYDVERSHWELAEIWKEIDADRDVRSCLFTWAVPPKGAPRPHIERQTAPWVPKTDPLERAEQFSVWMQLMREARDAIDNVLNSNKLIVSAIRGNPSYGIALMIATLADVSVASTTVRISDRHLDGAVTAGDGIAYWSLLCGVQKAKLLALACEEITGEEAERIGLVSLAVPDDHVMMTAMRYARRFADGPRHAQQFTKRAMNQWLRLATITSYETALTAEIFGFLADPDVEAVRSDPGYRGQGQESDPRFEHPRYPSVDHPYGAPS